MGRPVVFVTPHPDDEVLGFSVQLWRHVAAGRDVHILTLTRGIGTRVIDELNGTTVNTNWWKVRHNPALEGYAPLDPAAIGRARMREQQAACAAVGIPASHIHEANLPDDLNVTVDQARRPSSPSPTPSPRTRVVGDVVSGRRPPDPSGRRSGRPGTRAGAADPVPRPPLCGAADLLERPAAHPGRRDGRGTGVGGGTGPDDQRRPGLWGVAAPVGGVRHRQPFHLDPVRVGADRPEGHGPPRQLRSGPLACPEGGDPGGWGVCGWRSSSPGRCDAARCTRGRRR